MDIIDIILARAGSSGGGGGGDTSNAVTEVTVENADTSAAKIKKTKVRKNAITKAYEVMKNYVSKGQNEDGSMTQKAITAELDMLNTRIDNIIVGDINLGPENAGKLVLVGDDGGLVPGTLTEEDIKGGVIPPPPPPEEPEAILGLEIDYVNRTFTRLNDAEFLNAGAQFNQFKMYGGRMRCAVDDNGVINDFCDDTAYVETGRDGQIMIYQPKFYYKREVLEYKTDGIVARERIYISYGEQDGFKVHPLFINDDNEVLDYVFLPAYEGCAYDASAYTYMLNDEADVDFDRDVLSSVAGAKPISGINKDFTDTNAEKMAQNRGANWHITNMRAESANQMLMMIEYGQLNMQRALEWGPVTLTDRTNYNCSLLTGSTASLGSATGYAESSTQTIGENTYTVDEEKKRAISYRGMENPWGNMWRIIGGTVVIGNGSQQSGVPYICADYNYNPDTLENYISTGFEIKGTNMGGWVSNMGYANEDLDWVYFPARTGNDGASSVLPVGDYLWGTSKLNGMKDVLVGGQWKQKEQAGAFDYACDMDYDSVTRAKNARIMFVPTKDRTYEANIQKWKDKMGV